MNLSPSTMKGIFRCLVVSISPKVSFKFPEFPGSLVWWPPTLLKENRFSDHFHTLYNADIWKFEKSEHKQGVYWNWKMKIFTCDFRAPISRPDPRSPSPKFQAIKEECVLSQNCVRHSVKWVLFELLRVTLSEIRPICRFCEPVDTLISGRFLEHHDYVAEHWSRNSTLKDLHTLHLQKMRPLPSSSFQKSPYAKKKTSGRSDNHVHIPVTIIFPDFSRLSRPHFFEFPEPKSHFPSFNSRKNKSSAGSQIS